MRTAWRVLTIVLSSAAVVHAAETVSIKPHFVPGMRWEFHTATTMNLDNKASFNGQTQPFSMKNAQARSGKAEVIAATDGVPTSIRYTFDDSSKDETTIAGNATPGAFPYAGKSVTVTRAANGTVTDDFNDQVAHEQASELHGLLDSEVVFIPLKPVAVGEEWAADPGTLSRMLQLEGDDRAGMTLKLLGTKSVDGHDVAEIKASTVATRRQGDVQIRITLQGTAEVDLATGHPLTGKFAGDIQDHGQQPGPGPDGNTVSYNIEGSGTLSNETTSTLSMAAAGGGSTPAPSGENPLGAATADPFAGVFSDGKLSVDGATKDGGYIASLTLGDKKFPATATIKNHDLDGSFDAGGHPFPFTATLDGDVMTLTTGGKMYKLKRAAPPTPPAPANPLGQADDHSGDQKLPGYAVAVSVDAGKTLTTHKGDIHDVTAAFKSVFPELAHYFDDRPTLGGAFADGQGQNSGIATFTAHLNGQPVRGLVSCRTSDRGADVVVTYARADADAATWAKLSSIPADGVKPVPPLETYSFPDGSGSIGLAEGWVTRAPSAMQQVNVTGPEGQTVTIGFSIPVQTPDSPVLQMQRQTAAQLRQMGVQQPPQNFTFYVAPFSNPVQAMNDLMPQISAAMQKQGQPSLQIEHVQQTQQARASMQGGRAGILTYDVTMADRQGGEKHRRAMAEVELTPVGQGAWILYVIEAAASPERFAADLPTMLAIANSLKEDPRVCAQIAGANADAQRQQFEAGQQAHREQMAEFDAQNKAWEGQQVHTSRNNANFIEVIRGERAVLDTSTGEKGYADLTEAGKIADRLNEHDPGRYKELPLRDELYPVDGK